MEVLAQHLSCIAGKDATLRIAWLSTDQCCCLGAAKINRRNKNDCGEKLFKGSVIVLWCPFLALQAVQHLRSLVANVASLGMCGVNLHSVCWKRSEEVDGWSFHLLAM